MAFLPLIGNLVGSLFGAGRGIGGPLSGGLNQAQNYAVTQRAVANDDAVVAENMFANNEVSKFTESSIASNTEMQMAKQQGQIFFGAQQVEQQLVKSASQALQSG